MQNGNSGMQYLSTQAYLQEREIADQVADLYQDNDWIKMFLGEGKTIVTKEPSYQTGISAPINALVDTTGATVTNNASTAVTVAFTAGTSGALKKYDTVRTSNGNVGWVSSISTNTGTGVDTVIFTSVNASVLSITAGNKLSNFGNAYEEGSKLAPAIRNIPSFIGNKIQIIKHSVEMTDIRKASKITVKVKGGDGKDGQLNGAIIEGLMRHEADIAFTMLMGDISTTSFEDANPSMKGDNNRGVQTTRGLDKYITAYGINDTVTTPGTILEADIKDHVAQLTARRVGNTVSWIGAQSPVQDMSSFFKNTNSSGVQSVQMIVNGNEIDLTVEKVKYGSFTIQLGSINFLSNGDYVDQTSSLAKCLFVLPDGKCPTLGGGSVDYWRTRYMPIEAEGGNNKGTDRTAEFHYGMLAGNGTDSVHGAEFQTQIGLELAAPSKFGRLIVSS